MQPYELDILGELFEYAIKQEWEQTRLIGYVTAQTQTTKKLKLTDIAKFPWDKEPKKNNYISNKDIERLTAKAASVLKQQKQNKNNNDL